MSSNLISHSGIYYSEDTPAIVQEVIEDCIKRKVLVHVLSGSPLTGVVTPNLNSVGIIELSNNNKTPAPVLNCKIPYNPDGTRAASGTTRICLLKTSKILKITEVDSCKLLYQSYECQSSELRFIPEFEMTPYGDISEKTRVICENPKIEILVPADTDPKALCQFLFGQVHILPDCIDKMI